MNEFEIAKWLASACLTFSAIQVSINIRWSTKWWAYVGFFVGHVVWTIAAYRIEEWALFYLNIAFMLMDLYAIHIRINNEKVKQNVRNNAVETSNG